MEKKALVTLGMCVRNAERQVGDAIRSITEQNFSHDLIELIIVDDGSEDRSLSIINSWISKTDIEIRVFSASWGGVARARNIILNNAKGDFIMWIDSDQIWPKNYVREQVDFMKENPQVGIGTGLPWILPNWNLILSLEILSQGVDYRDSSKSAKRRLQRGVQLPGTGGSIFRIDALRQVNGFDDRLKGIGEDYDVARRITNEGWLCGYNSHIFYETHGGMSTMEQLWKRYFWKGYYSRALYMKNSNYISLPRISPIGSVIAGILYGIKSYKYTSMKKSFLIPLHFTFKMLAWFTGFLKSQIDGN